MTKTRNTLQQDFIVAPYSVIDTRTALWRNRRAMWHNMIGLGEETREGALFKSTAMRMPSLYESSMSKRNAQGISFEEYLVNRASEDEILSAVNEKLNSGVSTFDPVLSELVYRWFTPYEGAKIFDPFAGAYTKGVVATKCGYGFTGIELRPEQVAVNMAKCKEMNAANIAYINDDAVNIRSYLGAATQDLLFSCPPYYNLEVYSDLPNDASNQRTYDEFWSIIQRGFESASKCLKKNRFAVIVVSDVRDDKGCYYNLPGDVIGLFKRLGFCLWNDIVLLHGDPTAKLRARGYMATRKVVRTHERVLVFFNGRPSTIKKNFKRISTINDKNINQTAN